MTRNDENPNWSKTILKPNPQPLNKHNMWYKTEKYGFIVNKFLHKRV